jgi:glutamine synthetase
MNTPHGLLSLDDLQREIQAGHVDTVIAAFSDLYGRLMGKRFDASFFLDSVARSGTHVCDYLLTVDMEMEPIAGYALANWKKGYGDVHLVPDLGTLRRASWLDKTAIVLCDVHQAKQNRLLPHAPRSLLRGQIVTATDLGMQAMGGSELEYFIFKEPYGRGQRRSFARLTPSSTYLEDYHILQGTREERLNAAARRHLSHSGVPVEGTKGEWGLGQHELNLRYTDVLAMADRHTLQKQCLKEVADSLGMSVTFMAKYDARQAGSSCHLHLSLWRDGRNAFLGDQALAGIQCSDWFRWFLAGWLYHAADMMVFYAPTVNSYKRFQAGSWAPTRLAWSIDNRTAGFRVVGHDASLRIECRIPGADCNPYLAFAAALASGLDGIAHRREPPLPVLDDVYQAQEIEPLPRSLREATARFAGSELARQAFGKDVVEHYVHFFSTEQHAFDQAVTDWERLRYFERI